MPPLSSGTLYGETESSMQTLSTLVRARISCTCVYADHFLCAAVTVQNEELGAYGRLEIAREHGFQDELERGSLTS